MPCSRPAIEACRAQRHRRRGSISGGHGVRAGDARRVRRGHRLLPRPGAHPGQAGWPSAAPSTSRSGCRSCARRSITGRRSTSRGAASPIRPASCTRSCSPPRLASVARMKARLAAAAIVLLYLVLGLCVLSPEAVYSGDIGVKFVQAQALVEQRFRTPRHPVSRRSSSIPSREFFPIRPPFVMTTGGDDAIDLSAGGGRAPGRCRGPAAAFAAWSRSRSLAAAVVLVSSWKLAPPA